MGFLDSYFDNNSYASPQADLIDRLLGTMAPIQPSAGFPTSPMNAQASTPAPQQPQNASPLAIGSYQMPRIGQQSDFELPPGQLDPNTGEHVQVTAPVSQPTDDLGGHLATGYQNFRHGGGVLSSIVAAFTGQRNDPVAEAQQQQQQLLQRQFTTLVNAGMPANAAKAAVIAGVDSAVGKQLVGQHLGDDKFGFQALPDGTVIRTNTKTGEAAPAYQGSAKTTFGVIGEADGVKQYGWLDPTKRSVQPYQIIPGSGDGASGTITGPDGQPIAIPAGVDRKTFVNEISKTNADAATGKMTEAQAKASSFAARMDQAEATLQSLEGEGTSYKGKALDSVPVIGGTALTNSMQSNGYQKYRQAAGNFVTAMLRQESGAAISNSEFSRYEKEMLPQPGDGAEVLAQKRAARAAAIEQMRRAAGPGYKSPAKDTTATAPDPLGIR